MLQRTLVLLLAAGLTFGAAACSDSLKGDDSGAAEAPSGDAGAAGVGDGVGDGGGDGSGGSGGGDVADAVAATDPGEMASFCAKTKPLIATTNATVATYYENELAIAPSTIRKDLEYLAGAWRAHADSGSSGPIDDEPVVTAATLRVNEFQLACGDL